MHLNLTHPAICSLQCALYIGKIENAYGKKGYFITRETPLTCVFKVEAIFFFFFQFISLYLNKFILNRVHVQNENLLILVISKESTNCGVTKKVVHFCLY